MINVSLLVLTLLAATPSAPTAPMSITMDAPEMLAEFEKEAVFQAIGPQMGEIGACYATELVKNPGSGGRIIIQFTVAASGQVESAQAQEKSTIDSSDMKACVAKSIMKMKFPALKTNFAVVVLPLNFTPGAVIGEKQNTSTDEVKIPSFDCYYKLGSLKRWFAPTDNKMSWSPNEGLEKIECRATLKASVDAKADVFIKLYISQNRKDSVAMVGPMKVDLKKGAVKKIAVLQPADTWPQDGSVSPSMFIRDSTTGQMLGRADHKQIILEVVSTD